MSVAERIFSDVPLKNTSLWVLSYLDNNEFTPDHFKVVKDKTGVTDKGLAHMLNVSARTVTNYTNDVSKVKIDTKEHVLLLISLVRHGADVFGSAEEFAQWLKIPNFFYGHKAPIDYLNTISGIQYIDDGLTGMEYGDNA